jgi:hypothetical protein
MPLVTRTREFFFYLPWVQEVDIPYYIYIFTFNVQLIVFKPRIGEGLMGIIVLNSMHKKSFPCLISFSKGRIPCCIKRGAVCSL